MGYYASQSFRRSAFELEFLESSIWYVRAGNIENYRDIHLYPDLTMHQMLLLVSKFMPTFVN
jgi:hypothetical protein